MVNIYRFPSDLKAEYKDDKKNKDAYIKIDILDDLNEQATDTIALFAPSGFTIEDSGNYGSVNFGVADSISNLGRDVITNGGKDTEGKIGSMSTAESQLITQAVLKATGADSEIMTAQTAKNKIVFNNKTTATFEDMSIRTFSFTFKMVPESDKDSTAILDIENVLRTNYAVVVGVPNTNPSTLVWSDSKYESIVDQNVLA